MPLEGPHQPISWERVRKRRHHRRGSPDHLRHFLLSIALGLCLGVLLSFNFDREYEEKASTVVIACDAPPVKCPPVRCTTEP